MNQISKQNNIFVAFFKDLWIWFIFSITVGLLPVITNLLVSALENQKVTASELLGQHGDLALVSTALSAEAISELIQSGNVTESMATLWTFGSCFLNFFLSMILFIVIATAGTKINADIAASLSIILFVGTIVTGSSCKLLARRKAEEK